MIKAPFKRKSAPIGSSQSATSSSPKTMPRGRRGCSVTRSVSLGSSVNSLNVESISGAFAESDDIDNLNCTNIYAEIDVNNSILVCSNNKKPINQSMLSDNSSTDLDSDSKMCMSSDGEVRSNGSKNNLLEVAEMTTDDVVLDNDSNGNVMWTGGSVDTHLDNIDKINKILDDKILGNSKKVTPPSIQISRFIVTKLDESVLGLDTDHLKDKKMGQSNDKNQIDRRADAAQSHADSHSTEQSKPKPDSSSGGKKNRFMANKSVNAFLTSVKELKLSRKKSDEDVFEEIDPEPMKSRSIETTSIDGSSSSESETSSSRANKGYDDDAILIPQSCDAPQASSSKPLAKTTLKTRLKHNIKSKLKFNIKLTSKKRTLCQRCLKQRKFHTKNLFGIELTKEWSGGDGLLEIDLCCCSVDDLPGVSIAVLFLLARQFHI